VAVGAQAGEGAEAARLYLHRVERPMLDRRYAGVRPFVQRVALFAVERRRATAEGWVLALARMPVEFGDRGGQPCGVDAANLGQLRQGGAAFQVAAA